MLLAAMAKSKVEAMAEVAVYILHVKKKQKQNKNGVYLTFCIYFVNIWMCYIFDVGGPRARIQDE